MKNLKRRNVMKNNIDLFDKYIDDKLTADEKKSFDEKLRSDKEFALDFRVYLFTLKGLIQEAEQDNMEFGIAMKKISNEELLQIIGRTSKPRVLRLNYIRERLAWVASIAAILIVGIFSVYNINRNAMNRLDDTIVAYNYIPDSNRGWESITGDDIASLQEAYQDAPSDDIQAQQEAGMRLAMAYLKTHDRKKAKETLRDLSVRFANDEEFSAQCKRILDQLK